MPKEIIESKYGGEMVETDKSRRGEPGVYQQDDKTWVYVESTKVRLGWSKERDHVEIATVALPHQVLEHFDGEDNNGWFVQLNRHGINRLIKALRQARDDAYGKDM